MVRREVELLGGARSCHDACAERLANFDCRNPDATRGTCDEQNLAGLEPRAVLKAHVSGPVRNWECSGLQEVHLRRHLEDLRRRNCRFLGEVTKSGVPDDPIADRQMIDISPNLDDFAAGFHAGNDRQGRLVLVLVRDHERVRKIDCGRVHANSHLAGPRRPDSNVHQPQIVRPAIGVNLNCACQTRLLAQASSAATARPHTHAPSTDDQREDFSLSGYSGRARPQRSGEGR